MEDYNFSKFEGFPDSGFRDFHGLTENQRNHVYQILPKISSLNTEFQNDQQNEGRRTDLDFYD